MSESPWQRYQPPAGAAGAGPIGVGSGVAVSTASDVMLDGDGLGISFDATPAMHWRRVWTGWGRLE